MVKYFNGLDCVADADTEAYAKYADISQETITWMGQGVYALYCIYFGVVLLFIFVIRKSFYIFKDYHARYYDYSSNTKFTFISKINAVSRYLAYKRTPLLFSRITGLPASFGTLFLFFASSLYTLCYAFIPHFWYRGCSGFGTPPLAQRTGMIVMGMIPFLITISGKTNFISGVTGVSYEKLNIFHQALGWGSFFFSLVHTITFLVQDSLEGGLNEIHAHWKDDLLYRNGVPPLVFLFLLCFASLKTIRSYVYEIFWHCHWILGLAFVGTLAWHVYGAMGIEYIWGSLGFWGAQIVYRIIIKSPFRPNTYAFKHKEATVKVLPNFLFEITIPIRTYHEFFWKPGQHILIRFMHRFHTLDNHPFSIITVPNPAGKSTLKLIVKPQRGLTRKIYKNISNESNLEKKYNVYIDGAYGGMNRDSLAFDKLILVASGSGISVTLPFMLHVAQNLGNPSNNVQSIDFTWIIRNINSLDWIKNQLIELFDTISKNDEKYLTLFNINIFVTNSGDIQPNVIKSRNQLGESNKDYYLVSSNSKESLKTVNNYKGFLNIFMSQKPDLKKYIAGTDLLKKNAVIVSGPLSVQIAVGNAASELQKQVLKTDIQEVYLHSENFGW